jgi:hypothetical protein
MSAALRDRRANRKTEILLTYSEIQNNLWVMAEPQILSTLRRKRDEIVATSRDFGDLHAR